MLLLPAAIYVFSYFHRIAPTVVVADLMAAFAASASAVGLMTAVYPWIFASMALPGGSLVDRLGPRLTIAGGGTFMAAGTVLLGLAPTLGWAFAGRLLVGLGSSVMLIAWLRLGTAWARPDEMARLAGFTQTVGAVGGLVGTTPLAALVVALGWRQSFVVIGLVTAAVAVACALVIRDRPEAMGLPPLAERAGVSPAAGGALAGIGAVLANPRSWPPALVSAGVYGSFITFVGLWGVPYLVQIHGVTRLEASRSMAWAAGGIIVGAVSVGWLSDRMLRRRQAPIVALAVVYALLWFALALPAGARLPLSLMPPLCFLLGLSSSVVAIPFALIPEVNDPARPGVAIGFCNMPAFGAVAVLQWLSGAMLDAGWDGRLEGAARIYPPAAYRSVFLLCAGLATLAVVAAWRVTETRCRNVWRPSTATGPPPMT